MSGEQQSAEIDALTETVIAVVRDHYRDAREGSINARNRDRIAGHLARLGGAVQSVRDLHVPWYEIGGVRHDFTVISYGPDNLPADHDCDAANCLDRDDPESTEHQVLACSECRGTNPEYDDLTCHPFWPCPTIKALDRVFRPGTGSES